MSDLLGRLVQRSLTPSPPNAGLSAAEVGLAKLTPRLPSLFETPGGDLTAPEAGSPAPEEPGPPADGRPEIEGPRPSRTLVSQPQALVPRPAGGRADSPAATPVGPQPAGEGMARGKDRETDSPPRPAIQPIVIQHEPTSLEQASGESGTATPAPARLMPVTRLSPALLSGGEGRPVEAGGDAQMGEPRSTIVRINIGRIEVRAVHPAQPAAMPRKVAPTPRLTLDEYAKQRSEGKR